MPAIGFTGFWGTVATGAAAGGVASGNLHGAVLSAITAGLLYGAGALASKVAHAVSTPINTTAQATDNSVAAGAATGNEATTTSAAATTTGTSAASGGGLEEVIITGTQGAGYGGGMVQVGFSVEDFLKWRRRYIEADDKVSCGEVLRNYADQQKACDDLWQRAEDSANPDLNHAWLINHYNANGIDEFYRNCAAGTSNQSLVALYYENIRHCGGVIAH